MTRLLRICLIAIAVVAGIAGGRPAAATDPQAAQAYVEGLGERTLDLLQSGLGRAALIATFRDLFTEYFDAYTIGRFVLGRYWNRATPEQQEEYIELFRELIVQTYARRFSDYAGQSFSVNGAQPEGANDAMVLSQVIQPGAPPIAVQWRVRDQGGRLQIIDVVIEGISMAITYRNEFSSVIQRSGGRIEGLLDAMRRSIERERRAG